MKEKLCLNFQMLRGLHNLLYRDFSGITREVFPNLPYDLNLNGVSYHKCDWNF